MNLDNIEEWRLLVSIIQPFLDLAEFFATSDDKSARKAREEVDRLENSRKPFYADVYVELQSLVENVGTWDESLHPPKVSVTRVLEIFESRCHKKKLEMIFSAIFQSSAELPFQNLQNLLRRLEQLAIKQQSFDSKQLRSLINWKVHKSLDRRRILNRLTQCNAAFMELRHAARPLNSTSSILPEELHTGKYPMSFFHERRVSGEVLHQLLAESWQCPCPIQPSISHAAIMLRFETQNRTGMDSKTQYDVWFEIPCTSDSRRKWQAGGVFVFEDNELRQVAGIQDSTQSQVKSLKSKSVTIAVPSKGCIPNLGSPDGPRRVKELGLYQHVTEAAGQTSRQLKLLVRNGELQIWNPDFVNDTSGHHFVSLDYVIRTAGLSVLRNERSVKRYLLAFVIANGFLQACQSSWSPRDWTKQQIYFHTSRTETTLDICRPYLSTHLLPVKQTSSAANDVVARNRVHPYPCILALGFILLQIWLGRPIELERSADNPNNEADISLHNIDADYSVALKMLQECEYDSEHFYNDAIKACLREGEFPRGYSLNDESFRQQVYMKVVLPIEQLLLTGFKIDVRDLGTLSAVSALEPIQNHTPNIFNATAPLMNPFKNHQNSRPQTSSGPEFYEDETKKRNQKTDHWFRELNMKVHPTLRSLHDPRGGVQPLSRTQCRNLGRIKIAILDTGTEIVEDAMWARGYEDDQRIMYKSFLVDDMNSNADPDLVRGDKDIDGHGTHAAGLLLDVAPNSEIYSARVFRNRDEGKGEGTEFVNQRIVKALEWAIDSKVDIISLSFGFRTPVQSITGAIDKAVGKGILIFAAASNEGANRSIAWPARRKDVFCIHSTDSFGNPSDFTPTNNRNPYNFGLIGENIESHWPKHLGQNTLVRKSGTSIATPIAAGIAAIVIGFSKMISPDLGLEDNDLKDLDRLKDIEGMCVVFDLMVGKTGKRRGYDYVVPWNFLNAGPGGHKFRTTFFDVVIKDLRESA